MQACRKSRSFDHDSFFPDALFHVFDQLDHFFSLCTVSDDNPANILLVIY